MEITYIACLPANPNTTEFERLLNHTEEVQPMTKIAALLHTEDELKRLAGIFEKHGYQLRIAGGAVSDTLLSNKRYKWYKWESKGDRMRIIFKFAFMLMLAIGGFLDYRLDGTVYDYFNGHEDLKKGVCAFVGDPVSRIQEDYLRILRYFRFFARICNNPNNHKEEVLSAIKNNLDGLHNISGERIWTELNKILGGSFSKEMMLKMLEINMFPHLGLPANPNTTEFERLLNHTEEVQPMTKIAALLHTEDELNTLNKRLKLSTYEKDLARFIINHRHDVSSDPHPLRLYQNLLLFSKLKATTMREYIVELMKYKEKSELIKDFHKWRLPTFPMNGNIIRQYGTVGGKDLGKVTNFF
ncbi:CCA tRNA nucleotidyltransferase 1, mitochondrial [Diaphorina citri]|uniref:CCA tRNA nucleotidyltransferase 1, mitochondrial n=1 Tax=Diaphorina citri TaxID=121845 RepID=A0A3Q0J933_DIACI|nr:CCA tRNA nucleotidyltransferase 1, mitochondrial [Diaphorina citri]